MTYYKKLYRSVEWFSFAQKVKERDNFKCVKCSRPESKVILQVHHKYYKPNFKPWQYALSDCLTLCKGCHSVIHCLTEPTEDWILISIDDLSDLIGVCERKGCGTSIRYNHLIYHPNWGYLNVGSTCLEYLTREDQYLSAKTLQFYNKISDFVNKSKWDIKLTKSNKKFISAKYKHNEIRIYGKENYYSFQIAQKIKYEKWFNFSKLFEAKGSSLHQVKELAIITLNGLEAETETEKKYLRQLYKITKK